jgi:tetratricopeptide (TPR) repeat protein
MRHGLVTSLAVVLAAVCVRDLRSQPPDPAQNVTRQVQQTAQPQQTEADRRFAEIIKAARGHSIPADIVPQLEQFIRDYPNYPRLDTVYSSLLLVLVRTLRDPKVGIAKNDPERLTALADEVLAKFTADVLLRGTAYGAKFTALDAQKNDEGIRALGRKILQTEASSYLLESAAQRDKTDALELLDKAIVERSKHPETTERPTLEPTLGDLRWSYGRSLAQGGRKAEALKLWMAVIEETTEDIAKLEQLPQDDPKRPHLESLQETLSDRSGAENTRADLYEKLGKPDLALDCLVRAFAERMDQTTRDRIATLAQKTGKNPGDSHGRAREIRNRDARPIYPFDLVTDTGRRMKLADVKEKVILVNFFYPT